MSDRLAELQRQRVLLQEHLAWLDREITAERVKSGETSASPAAAPRVATPLPPAAPAPGSATPDADALSQKYTTSPESLQADVRKGCFLYVALASIALLALVTVLYFAVSKR